MPKNLGPFKIIDNEDLAQASIISGVVDGRFLQQIKFAISWTGNSVGTLSLQESLDYNPVYQTGTWFDNGAAITGPAGSSNSALVNLSNRAPSWYRIVFTRTSGDGFMTVWASGAGY